MAGPVNGEDTDTWQDGKQDVIGLGEERQTQGGLEKRETRG